MAKRRANSSAVPVCEPKNTTIFFPDDFIFSMRPFSALGPSLFVASSTLYIYNLIIYITVYFNYLLIYIFTLMVGLWAFSNRPLLCWFSFSTTTDTKQWLLCRQPLESRYNLVSSTFYCYFLSWMMWWWFRIIWEIVIFFFFSILFFLFSEF